MKYNNAALLIKLILGNAYTIWRSVTTAIIVYSTFAPGLLHAADLLDLYMLAAENDTEHRKNIATRDAALERHPQALSQLLPNINLSANTYNYDQDISATNIGNIDGNNRVDFNRHGYELRLTQPLFQWGHFVTAGQAKVESVQAEAILIQSEQELIVRVAERYFAILAEQDRLAFARAEKKSLAYQLKQVKEFFNVGLTTDTDLQEAQAGYDRTVAAEIRAVNELDNAIEAMREITNSYASVLAPLTEDIPLRMPAAWSEQGLQNNIAIQIAQHMLDIAEKEIEKQRAEHYPTVDLVAQYGYDSSGGGRFGEDKTNTTAVGLNLNLPIFQGGATNSQVRQAYAQHRAALAQLEQARRGARRQARQAYLGVISGVSQIKALKQAMLSSEAALTATTVGFKVGTRTAVDLVVAEQATFSARKDYAQARYVFLLNGLRLKQAMGELTVADLQQLNRLLIAPHDK